MTLLSSRVHVLFPWSRSRVRRAFVAVGLAILRGWSREFVRTYRRELVDLMRDDAITERAGHRRSQGHERLPVPFVGCVAYPRHRGQVSTFEFAIRRVLLEVGTDDDWSIVCAFSANHGVEAVHAAAREMSADLSPGISPERRATASPRTKLEATSLPPSPLRTHRFRSGSNVHETQSPSARRASTNPQT